MSLGLISCLSLVITVQIVASPRALYVYLFCSLVPNAVDLCLSRVDEEPFTSFELHLSNWFGSAFEKAPKAKSVHLWNSLNTQAQTRTQTHIYIYIINRHVSSLFFIVLKLIYTFLTNLQIFSFLSRYR